MTTPKLLLDLFERDLQNLYNSELLILQAMPKMLEHATDTELIDIIHLYEEETANQKDRIEKIGTYLNVNVTKKDGNIIRALLEDVDWLYDEFQKGLLMDIGIVSKLQHIQHFQISGYETSLLIAKNLDIKEVSELLDQTLVEAYEGDETCSFQAKRLLNKWKGNDRNIQS